MVSTVLLKVTTNFSPGGFNFSNLVETPVQGINDYIYKAVVVQRYRFSDNIPVSPKAKSISISLLIRSVMCNCYDNAPDYPWGIEQGVKNILLAKKKELTISAPVRVF